MPTERTARRFIAACGGDLVLPQATERRLCRRKDLSLLVGSCCFVRCFEVCRTSELLKKVLIAAVRSCGCGVLNRGLKNLEASCERDVFRAFCVVQKEPKSTPEVCEPLDSGDDSKLCRKRFCKTFRRHVPKPVLPAKRRRKGFESVRKGYRSADARPMFFEKQLFYCKLTVGCRG